MKLGCANSCFACSKPDLHLQTHSSVLQWLQKIAPRQIDLAVEVLEALLRDPQQLDQWVYMTQRDPIRTVLSEGLKCERQGPHTVNKAKETISFLSDSW